MIDPIHRQTLTDQIAKMRSILDQMSAHAQSMETLADCEGGRQAALSCGVKVQNLGLDAMNLSVSLYETANRFDVPALIEECPF